MFLALFISGIACLDKADICALNFVGCQSGGRAALGQQHLASAKRQIPRDHSLGR